MPARAFRYVPADTMRVLSPKASYDVGHVAAWTRTMTERAQSAPDRGTNHPDDPVIPPAPQANKAPRRTDIRIPHPHGPSMRESPAWPHHDTTRTRTSVPSWPSRAFGRDHDRTTHGIRSTVSHLVYRIPHSHEETTHSLCARMRAPPAPYPFPPHRDRPAMIPSHNLTVSAGPVTFTALVPAKAAG